ncbi:hypothetical protein N7494_002130 [Penicillium frequentans]|uniref:Zn(2)-C6 fungal-type domain-containing protein n=1 Tax=Penicillium frequentans TaxID=3151616 RepID=A0AAD6D329_9EURO|nr:hypothetical protein N7494_002130 [Penicillium glabrum]
MNRLQAEGHHAPGPHGGYEGAYRAPYPPPPPPYDHQEPRRLSNQAHPHPLPGFAVNPNRQLPQLPEDGPYGRPNSIPNGISNGLPAPSPHQGLPEPSPIHTGYRPPINGSPHEASPQSAPPDYRARMSYQSNEGSIPSESTPPISVPPHAPHYVSPAAQVPVGPSYPYDPGYAQNPAYGARQQQQRKAARATQACDQCRARKAKCDEGRPACSHCKENNLSCVYKEVPPHKQDKGAQVLLDRIDKFQDSAQDNFDHQNEKMDISTGKVENRVESLRDELSRKLDSLDHNIKLLMGMTPMQRAGHQPHLLEQSFKVESQLTQPEIPNESASFSAPDDGEGELSIPVEHTTAAHKLLMWPSIQELLSAPKYDADYVMILEERRGLISVYGQGENSFTADDTQLASAITGWDHRGVNDDGTSIVQGGAAAHDLDAEIDRHGLLRLDARTADRYYRSYLTHLHRLHPFLDPSVLTDQIAEFCRIYCPQDQDQLNTMCRDNPGSKRKRSWDDMDGVRGAPLDPSAATSRPRVGKNIDNAVILLIFALGAICETKSPLPGPITDEKCNYMDQDIPAPAPPLPASLPKGNGTKSFSGLSPANSEVLIPPSYSNATPSATSSFSSTTGKPSTTEKDFTGINLSRRHISTTKNEYGNVKNLQVIPGLALYGYATQILGLLQGGVELEHVHAGLLAGLYAGQLAHPFQSHGWISQAARACQVLVRQKRYERLEEGLVKDMYNFAYWTCLQLESDLLAELDIPASGISRSEGRITIPKGKHLEVTKEQLEAQGKQLDIQAKQLEAHGKHFEAKGKRLEAQGKYLEAQGQHLEVKGQHLEAKGKQLEAQAKYLEAKGQNRDIKGAHLETTAGIISPDPMLMFFYSAQIHLRKVLNRVHTDLYKVEKANEKRWSSSVQKALSVNLDLWRTSLPDYMKWDDTDPPATEINAARMRAKYYGARYIIHRPLLYHALHYGQHGARVDGHRLEGASVDSPTSSANTSSQQMSPSMTQNPRAQPMSRIMSDMTSTPNKAPKYFPNGLIKPTVKYRDLPPQLRAAVKACIDSAIQSTQAFDGIEDRLVVTNIFGTAHAQFGNMLVLSATQQSNLDYVSKDLLGPLLRRTINFLLRSQHISPTLRADARILTEIYEKIFEETFKPNVPVNPPPKTWT